MDEWCYSDGTAWYVIHAFS